MATVFINYRREDSAGEARALFEELRGRLGPDSVFMDVEAIALGRDFRAVLAQRLATVDVMLALIGKGWLDSRDDENKRRLDDPNDFVRGEIRAALERDIPVTPLLVQDAQMPREADLPSDMRDLAFRNAFELSHARWGSDVNELVHRLGLTLSQPSSATIVTGSPAPGKPAANEPPTFARAGSTALVGRGRTLSWSFAAAAVVLLVSAAGYWFFNSIQADRARLQQANAELEAARARQAEALAQTASEAARRQRLEQAEATAKRDAENRARAEDAQKAAASERERLERQVRLDRERAAKEQAARDQAARDQAARAAADNQATKAKPGQPTLPDESKVAANASRTATVDAAEAERRLTEIRAGRFSGSLASSLGDFAVAWGIAPGSKIGQPIPARALSGGAAARPCGILARQIPDSEREDFLSTCLALPSYGMQAPLDLGVRPSQQAWMRFCTSRADAADAGGDARMRMMRTCLRLR